MDQNLVRLQRHVVRVSNDVRKQRQLIEQLVARGEDSTAASRVLLHMEADLRLFLNKEARFVAKAG